MSDQSKATPPPVRDAWAEGRDLANRAVAALQAHGQFSGSLILDGGWELSSPTYVADIGHLLDDRRRAKAALHDIIQNTHKGLGI